MNGQAPLYVLRHGETEWNREGRIQGARDSALTERGRAQAAVDARAGLSLKKQQHAFIRRQGGGEVAIGADCDLAGRAA